MIGSGWGPHSSCALRPQLVITLFKAATWLVHPPGIASARSTSLPITSHCSFPYSAEVRVDVILVVAVELTDTDAEVLAVVDTLDEAEDVAELPAVPETDVDPVDDPLTVIVVETVDDAVEVAVVDTVVAGEKKSHPVNLPACWASMALEIQDALAAHPVSSPVLSSSSEHSKLAVWWNEMALCALLRALATVGHVVNPVASRNLCVETEGNDVHVALSSLPVPPHCATSRFICVATLSQSKEAATPKYSLPFAATHANSGSSTPPVPAPGRAAQYHQANRSAR